MAAVAVEWLSAGKCSGHGGSPPEDEGSLFSPSMGCTTLGGLPCSVACSVVFYSLTQSFDSCYHHPVFYCPEEQLPLFVAMSF